MVVGVLALQGDVSEHILTIKRADFDAIPVRYREELSNLNGLIIPGGESTTIGKLLKEHNLYEEIKKIGREGFPIFGTCAGTILMGKKIVDSLIEQPILNIMDIYIRRNAYGRHRESFEAEFPIPELNIENFKGIFIRAPVIEKTGENVKVLAHFQGSPVLVREGNLLASTFHPELTFDLRIHQYFFGILREWGKREQSPQG